MKHLTLLAATAAVLGLNFAAAGTASAQQQAPDLIPRVTVKFALREFATDAGALAVYRRIEAAARQVCPAQSIGSLIESSASRECERAAVARAVAQISEPRLAAIAARRAARG